MRISVALCSHNGEQYLSEQIDSILDQSFDIDELIICDDISTDRTINIIQNYELKNPGLIKVYCSAERIGTIKNFEKAISLCTGDFIFLADQDDIWIENKVKRILDFFKANPNCEVIFTNSYLIDSNRNAIPKTLWDNWDFDEVSKDRWRDNYFAFKDLVKNQNKITGATMCLKRNIVKEILPMKSPLGYWHDALIGVHAAGRNSLMFLDEPLMEYRIHKNQQVGLKRKIKPNVILQANPNYLSESEFRKALFKLYPLKIFRIFLEMQLFKIKKIFS